jgi:hypothetical protein
VAQKLLAEKNFRPLIMNPRKFSILVPTKTSGLRTTKIFKARGIERFRINQAGLELFWVSVSVKAV